MELYKGMRVRVIKPKNLLESPIWLKEMDLYNNKIFIINDIRKYSKSVSYVTFKDCTYLFSEKWVKPERCLNE
jgi:hypothetical protein